MANTRVKATDLEFVLLPSLNRIDFKNIAAVLITKHRLRSRINFDRVDHVALVAELQFDWPGAIRLSKELALDTTAHYDGQAPWIADQLRFAVEDYISEAPKVNKDATSQSRHIYIAAAMFVEAIYEIQTGQERKWAKYLFGQELEKVDIKRPDESDDAYMHEPHSSREVGNEHREFQGAGCREETGR